MGNSSELMSSLKNKLSSYKLKYQDKYAKGGKILSAEKDKAKFAKIGVTDKYEIEAANDIGLNKITFTKEGLNKAIKDEFDTLLKTYQDYAISEDSNAITTAIKRDIAARERDGDSKQNIKMYEGYLTDETERNRYIQEFRRNQINTASEWVTYLKQSDYNLAFKTLILRAVLNYNYDYKSNKLIERDNKLILNFVPFDAGTLAELYESNSDYLLQDYTIIQNENAAKVLRSKEIVKETADGKWVKFNGGSKTSEEEILKNSKELSQLVQNTYWCTKTNSFSQLQGGDFYVFVTEKDGEVFPRIAVRMEEDKVGELRGNKSSKQDLETEMLPIAEDFLINNIPNDSGKKWLDSIHYNEKVIAFTKEIQEAPLSLEAINEYVDIKVNEKKYLVEYSDENGNVENLTDVIKNKVNNNDYDNVTLFQGDVITRLFDFTDKTKIFFGDAIFTDYYSQIKNLEIITGNANFKGNYSIKNLGNLTVIGGNANFYYNKTIKSLGDLTKIGGYANFKGSSITDLGNLTKIGGDADFWGSDLTNLGNLTTIGGKANFENSAVTDLGNLTTIGGDTYFGDSEIEDLGKLTTIGGNVNFNFNKSIKSLGNLTSIGGNADFFGDKIFTGLGNLTTIFGNVNFSRSELQNLGNLTLIGGNAIFEWSKIKDLGKLNTIGGSAFFTDSIINDLGNLTTIGRNADFKSSFIIDLGNLNTIGRNADFSYSSVIELGKLTKIGNNAIFRNSSIINLGQLKTIGGSADFRGNPELEAEWERRLNLQKNNQ